MSIDNRDSRYNFELEIITGDTSAVTSIVELSPLFQTLKFNWQRENDECFHRLEIESSLKFKKEDFEIIFALDQESLGCDNVFSITDYCQDDTGVTVFNGFLNTKEGTYDCDSCTVNISPSNFDEYTCLLDEHCETEINIFDCVPESGRTSVESFYGEIECRNCVERWDDDNDPIPDNVIRIQPENVDVVVCLPSGESWTVVNTDRTIFFDIDTEIVDVTVRTRYCRERYEGALPPSSDPLWQNIEPNVWVRPLNTAYVGGGVWSIAGYNNTNGDTFAFDNGIKLTDILQCLADQCDLEVKSDFFNYNSDDTHPNNSAYAFAEECLSCVVVFDNFDITISDGDADNNSSIANISFCKMREILRNMYNVKFIIDDGCLRVEHVSYFNESLPIGLDLTLPKYDKYTVGTNIFEYDKLQIPNSESWKWQYDSTVGFESKPFTYSCATNDSDEEYDLECVNTDISWMTAQNEEDLDEDGFTFIATDNNGVIINGNTCHTWCSLQENLLNYNRPVSTAQFNGGTIEFESVLPLKIQSQKIRIPICCNDYLNFSPNMKVKTKLGEGIIESAIYDSYSESLELTLRYS
jgi:hypothetical protein